MPLPHSDAVAVGMQVAGCGLRFTVARPPSPVTRLPSPATRLPSAARMWERLPGATRSGRDERRGSGDEGRCALRAQASGFPGRGWKPLPQAGYGLQSTVYGPPSPVSRLPCTARMWERHPAAATCGGRVGRRGSGGEGWCALRARPFDLPVTCSLQSVTRKPVTRLPSTPATRAGLEAPPTIGSRLAVYGVRSPVIRNLSPVSRALHECGSAFQARPAAEETGGGGRETRVGAPFGRGRLVFLVTRLPQPVSGHL